MKCTQSHASIHLREQILGVFDKCLHPHRGTALKETLGISSLQRFQPALSLPAQQPCGESTSYARVWRFTGHRLRPARPPPPLSVRPSLGVGGGCQAAKKVLGLGTPRSSQGGPWAPAEAQLRTRSQAWSSLTSRAPHSPGGRGGANGRNAVRAGRRPGLAAAA